MASPLRTENFHTCVTTAGRFLGSPVELGAPCGACLSHGFAPPIGCGVQLWAEQLMLQVMFWSFCKKLLLLCTTASAPCWALRLLPLPVLLLLCLMLCTVCLAICVPFVLGFYFCAALWAGSIAIHASWLRDFACLLYTSPSPRDQRGSRMPSSA